MTEHQPPRKNCWGGDRMCCGCGQQIVPREQAWVTGTLRHERFYHTDCLIKFLWGAWLSFLPGQGSWRERVNAESEAKMWKGNHAHMVQLNKGLRAKLAAIDAERHRLDNENNNLRHRIELMAAAQITRTPKPERQQ